MLYDAPLPTYLPTYLIQAPIQKLWHNLVEEASPGKKKASGRRKPRVEEGRRGGGGEHELNRIVWRMKNVLVRE